MTSPARPGRQRLADIAPTLLSIGTLTVSVLYGVFYFYLNALYNAFEVPQLSTVGITPASFAATLATALGVVLVVAVPVLLGLWLLARLVRRRRPGSTTRRRRLPTSTTARLALAFLGSVAILGVLAFFEARGTADARQLKRFAELGQQVDDNRRSLLLSFTGQPAQLVEPRWTASPPPLRFGRGELVLYLGQSEGTIVVWRPLTRAVLKIPVGSVVLVIPPSGEAAVTGRVRDADQIRGGARGRCEGSPGWTDVGCGLKLPGSLPAT